MCSHWFVICGIVIALRVFCHELMAVLLCRCERMSSGVEQWNMWAWCQNWTICHRLLLCCMKTQPRTLALMRGDVKFIVQIIILISKIGVEEFLCKIHLCLWQSTSLKWFWMSSNPSFLTTSHRYRSTFQNFAFKQSQGTYSVQNNGRVYCVTCPVRST
jgi:hypothetical protein